MNDNKLTIFFLHLIIFVAVVVHSTAFASTAATESPDANPNIEEYRINAQKLHVYTTTAALKTGQKNRANTLRIAFGSNKPPFMFGLGTKTGLEVDIVREAFAIAGYEVKPLQLTYGQLTKVLEQDRTVAGAAGVQKDPGKTYFYSNNYVTFENYAYTRSEDGISLQSFDDLKGYKIAIWGDGHKHLGERFYNLFKPDARKAHMSMGI